jgi:hypothetical protein
MKGSVIPPVIIFHGLTVGWFAYQTLIEKLSADRTVILFNYDCIKMNSMVFEAPSADEVNDNVK